MKKELVAIIIPIYKETLDDMEMTSLIRCLRILFSYKIIFCVPNSLKTKFYEDFSEGKANIGIERFDNKYFQNIGGYNKLMLSPQFYKRFFNYKFILIYQLDAFVFKDDLLYWCNKNYDFIGAPQVPHNNLTGEMQFLKNYQRFLKLLNILFKGKRKISNVGNGGFSLRKTKSFYYLLKILWIKANKWNGNEDGFFKYWGNLFYPFFKLPSDEIALSFSIEVSPREALKKLNDKLPFGCHAFKKYDWETWKPFINDQS